MTVSMSMIPVPILRFPNLRIPEGTLILQTSLMGLVLHMHKARQLQYPLNPIPQPLRYLTIIRPIPHADNILRVTDGYDGATYLIGGYARELTPDEGEDDLLPVSAREAFFQAYDPLPTPRIGRVLPCGFDAGAEEVIIGGGGQVVGTDEVVVHVPEFLDGFDGCDLFDG